MSASILLHMVKKEMNMAQKYDYVLDFFRVKNYIFLWIKNLQFSKINFFFFREWLEANIWDSTIQFFYPKETQQIGILLWLIFYVKIIVFHHHLQISIFQIFWIFISRYNFKVQWKMTQNKKKQIYYWWIGYIPEIGFFGYILELAQKWIFFIFGQIFGIYLMIFQSEAI